MSTTLPLEPNPGFVCPSGSSSSLPGERRCGQSPSRRDAAWRRAGPPSRVPSRSRDSATHSRSCSRSSARCRRPRGNAFGVRSRGSLRKAHLRARSHHNPCTAMLSGAPPGGPDESDEGLVARSCRSTRRMPSGLTRFDSRPWRRKEHWKNQAHKSGDMGRCSGLRWRRLMGWVGPEDGSARIIHRRGAAPAGVASRSGSFGLLPRRGPALSRYPPRFETQAGSASASHSVSNSAAPWIDVRRNGSVPVFVKP